MRDAPRGQEGKWAVIPEDAPDGGKEHWCWHWPVDCREMIGRGGWVLVPGSGPQQEDAAPILKQNLPYYGEGERPEDGAPPEAGPEPEVEPQAASVQPEKEAQKAPKPRKRRAPRKPRKSRARE